MNANPTPYSFEEARSAARKASEAQAATERAMEEASRSKAAAEQAYREALAKRLLKANATEGIAWTACADVARGDPEVAQLRYRRDVAAGAYEVIAQAGWRHASDRRDLGRLVEWSMRVAPEGQLDEQPTVEYRSPRRVA